MFTFMLPHGRILADGQWGTSSISEKSDGLDASEPSLCSALSKGGVKTSCAQLGWLCSV